MAKVKNEDQYLEKIKQLEKQIKKLQEDLSHERLEHQNAVFVMRTGWEKLLAEYREQLEAAHNETILGKALEREKQYVEYWKGRYEWAMKSVLEMVEHMPYDVVFNNKNNNVR